MQRRADAAELSEILRQYTWIDAARALSDAVLEADPGAGNLTRQGPSGLILPREGVSPVPWDIAAWPAEGDR